MTTTYQKTKDCKETQFSWTGNIPHDWEIEKVKAFFYFSKERASDKENDILSLTLKGIKVRDISGNEGQLAETYENYSKLRKGDVVLNPMDLISGWVTDSDIEGIISPAYKILRLKKGKELNVKFISKYLQWHWLFEIFFPFGQGVSVDHRWTLGNDTLMNFPILIPPIKTQERIADFLDEKTAVIDTVIEKKQKLIDLLKEKRTAIITKAVTKGLDPKANIKDSGSEWIGNIPESWEVKRIRFLFQEISEKDHSDAELLSVYRDYGVVPTSSRDDNHNVPSEDLSGYKYIRKGDLVFNKMKTWQGSIAVSQFEGIVSPAYYVAKFKNPNLLQREYAHFLLRSALYISMYKSISIGIRPNQWDMGFDRFKDLFALIPAKKDQELIVNFIEQNTKETDKLIDLILNQVEKLRKYRSSLIYNVVTGKITI